MDLNTRRHVPSNTLLDVKICTSFLQSFFFKKPFWKLSKSTPKAPWKQALRKLSKSSTKALWKLSESSMKFFLKAGFLKTGLLLLKARQKQADFRWKLSQSRMTLVESSMKAFQKARKLDNTKFRDKIAYVGGPSFCRRPLPFGDRLSRGLSTSATLDPGIVDFCKVISHMI